jgi:hypothetical protein
MHHTAHFRWWQEDTVLHSLDAQKAIAGSVSADVTLDEATVVCGTRDPASGVRHPRRPHPLRPALALLLARTASRLHPASAVALPVCVSVTRAFTRR